MADLPKLTNDYVIDKLDVKPEGEHQWVQLSANDPDQFNLYRNDIYLLLVRSHILDVYDGPDAFEVILLTPTSQVLFHEDVLEEDMNKESILNTIREFNSKN